MNINSAENSFCPPDRQRFVLAAAILASSMAFIDGSVVSIALPAIRTALGASLADAQWISNSYLLLLASLLLIGGAAADRFGLRNVFSLGITMFVLASAACAVAPAPGLLIGARALQGLGAAFMVPGSLAIIAKAYPREQRAGAIGVWAMASSLTTMLGPVLGGLMLDAFGDGSWRLVFAINLPLGIGAVALLRFKVPADRAGASRGLDLVGGVLATLALFAIAFGLTPQQGDSLPPLSHIAMFTGGGLVLLLAFLLWESRVRQPMMPLRLFANRGFAGANALTLALYSALSAFSFYLPMVLIAGWGISPAGVAIVMLPFGIALTILSPISGKWAGRFGAGPPIALGSVLVALAFAGMALTMPLHHLWLVLTPLVGLLGVGMGLVISPLSAAVMSAVEDTDTGIASGINNAVARVAALLGIAVMGGVVGAVFEQALGRAAELPIFFGDPVGDGLSQAERALGIAATDTAFSALAWAIAALALCSAAIAWFALERKRPVRQAEA